MILIIREKKYLRFEIIFLQGFIAHFILIVGFFVYSGELKPCGVKANHTEIMERSNTYRYAERELSILSKSAKDPENRPIVEQFANEILELCDRFGKSGQSGGSAPYTATALSQTVKKLCLQEPICPITGIDEEWNYIRDASETDNMMYQNSRCSALFKGGDGKSWYLDAIVWKTQSGHTWSGSALLQDGTVFIKYLSRQHIKSFPFTPKTFYIDVIEKEVAKDDWEFHIKDPRQLKKVFKYYDLYN